MFVVQDLERATGELSAVLTDARNLTGANLTDANLTDATSPTPPHRRHLTDANLTDAIGRHGRASAEPAREG